MRKRRRRREKGRMTAGVGIYSGREETLEREREWGSGTDRLRLVSGPNYYCKKFTANSRSQGGKNKKMRILPHT